MTHSPTTTTIEPAPSAVGLAIGALLTAIVAGFFGTYQWSVVLGLDRVGDAAYVESFQQINDTVRTPWFAVVFFGSAIVGVVNAVRSIRARAGNLIIGVAVAAVAVYVLGVLVVTFAANVPLNDELAAVTDPVQFAAARADFERSWNRWNLVRAVSSTVAAVFAVTALAARARRHGQ